MKEDDDEPDIFDYMRRRAEAEAAKKAGMEQVDDNANPSWKEAFSQAIYETCCNVLYLTTDDVRDLYDTTPGPRPTTHDLRSIGPRMREAAKLGWCEKYEMATVPSRRKSRHNGPMQRWKSKIFRGPQ